MRDPAASPSFLQSPPGFASQRRVCRGILGLLLASVLLCSGHSRGENRVQVPLADDFDLQVRQFPAAGKRLLIWLPSKYGIRAGNTWFAHTVQAAGIDHWLVDLHASYQAPTGRYGYANFEPRHVAQLIEHAVQQGWQHIVLGGESRGGRLAMQAARQWQLQHPGQTQLRGLLLFHPHLIFGNTPIGEKADLRPIVQATNLPLYILQPELNMKYLYSKALLNQLEAAGAPVYFHFLEDVRGGFHVRDADRITPTEAAQRERLGRTIRFALQRLAELPLPANAAQPPPATSTQRERRSRTTDLPLVPLDNRAAPSLALADARGEKIHLAEFEGEVVLVNFWATWCGPCIREIGSLSRLNQAFADRPFRLLAVNISETEAHVERFFDQLGIEPEFEVLYDPTGAAARTWDIYTIPSTYLVDKQQRLRFGYRGALEWDRADVVELIRELTD